jgi:hypothetical protein
MDYKRFEECAHLPVVPVTDSFFFGMHFIVVGRHTENPLHGASTKRAALYVRVSTDAKTVENQIRELRQVARRRGGCGYLEGCQVAQDRDWHGAAHLKGASNELARGAAMTSGFQLTNSSLPARLDPPVGGLSILENLVMPPLTKTRPNKGVAFVCKTLLQKKFLVSGEIPLAAASHRFFGNTLLKAGHLMRLSVVSRTVRGLALGIASAVSKPRVTSDLRTPTPGGNGEHLSSLRPARRSGTKAHPAAHPRI